MVTEDQVSGTRIEPIIAVRDVEKSSQWYQKLLNCKSSHGGSVFEILTNEDDVVILCLHKWGKHEHPTMIRPTEAPGNGLILYFRSDDIQTIWENAEKLGATIVDKIHLNQNSGRKEFHLRDLDGYYLIVSL